MLVGSCDGFVGNRMYRVYTTEVCLEHSVLVTQLRVFIHLIIFMFQLLFLLEEGASVEQIDRVMEEFGFPLGHFKIMDLSGACISNVPSCFD